MADKKPPPLPRFTLEKNTKRGGWDLKREGADRATKHFENKSEATARGALSKALPAGIGTVRIRKENGKLQEERTFPRSRDPDSTPG